MFPTQKTNTSTPAPNKQQQQPLISEEEFKKLPTSPVSTKPLLIKPNLKNFVPDVSPAVQSIMSQLLRTNNQLTSATDQAKMSTLVTNMATSLLGQPGEFPSHRSWLICSVCLFWLIHFIILLKCFVYFCKHRLCKLI